MERIAQMHPTTMSADMMPHSIRYSPRECPVTRNPDMVTSIAPPANGNRFRAAVEVPAMDTGKSSLTCAYETTKNALKKPRRKLMAVCTHMPLA